MNLKLPQRSVIQKIETMQRVLKEAEDQSTKAEAQEEVLLKQLNELFECETLEEGKELLDQLMDEKDEMDSDIENKTNDLWLKMKEDGLI
jgi:hypothetical protein